MMQRVKTILLVTIVTAIVWLFAEAESVRSKDVALVVELVAEPDSGFVIDPVDTQVWRGRVEVTVSGSAAALAGFEAGSIKPIRLSPGRDGVPTEPGESQLDLKQALRMTPLFATRGVTISRVEPSVVRVTIDQIATRNDVAVDVIVQGAQLEGPASVTPSRVKIVGPAAVLRRLGDAPKALVRLLPEQVSKLVGGRKETLAGRPVEAPLELNGFGHVTVIPPKVDVEVTIGSRAQKATVANVPVQVMIPALVAPLWDVRAEKTFFTDVEAVGPAEAIDQLKRNELRVYATVALSPEDLERGTVSKEASFFTLPASALTFKVESPIVKVVAKRRPAGDGGEKPPGT
ncbi:MAG: hypothetical protein AABZ53_09710 [Planctomycetota bacterium]